MEVHFACGINSPHIGLLFHRQDGNKQFIRFELLRNIGVAWRFGLDELEILREPFLNLRFVFFAQALQFTHALLHLLDDLGVTPFIAFATL